MTTDRVLMSESSSVKMVLEIDIDLSEYGEANVKSTDKQGESILSCCLPPFFYSFYLNIIFIKMLNLCETGLSGLHLGPRTDRNGFRSI